MITASENLKFTELAQKTNVPVDIVKLLLANDCISNNDALKLLSGVRSIKEKGISYRDKEILFGPNMFERVKKVFELLNDIDIDDHFPFITGNMAAALGRYWWD